MVLKLFGMRTGLVNWLVNGFWRVVEIWRVARVEVRIIVFPIMMRQLFVHVGSSFKSRVTKWHRSIIFFSDTLRNFIYHLGPSFIRRRLSDFEFHLFTQGFAMLCLAKSKKYYFIIRIFILDAKLIFLLVLIRTELVSSSHFLLNVLILYFIVEILAH